MDITRFLPNNEYQAAIGANAPSASNPFATINDLTGQDTWAELLANPNGNNTGGSDTIWSSGDVLKSAGISNLLATVVGPIGAGPTEDQTTLTGITLSVHGNRSATIKVGASITISGSGANDGVHTITAAETIGIGPYKTFFQFAGISADVAGGTVTTVGALTVNFNNPEFYAPNENLDGYMFESNDGLGSTGKAWREFHPNYHQLAYGQAYIYLTDGGTNNSAFTIYGANYSFFGRPYYAFNIIGENSFSVSVGNTLFTKTGNMIIQENDTAGYTTGNIANYPGAFIAQNTTINQNVTGSAAIGTNGAIVKTNDTTYVNALAFNAGLTGEMRLVHTPNASDFTATLQAASGTIAYLSDVESIYGADGTIGAGRIATITDILTFTGGDVHITTGDTLDSSKGFYVKNSDNKSMLEIKNNGEFVIGSPTINTDLFYNSSIRGVFQMSKSNSFIEFSNAPVDGVTNNTTADNQSIGFSTRNSSGDVARILTFASVRNRNVTPGSEYGVLTIGNAIQTENSDLFSARTVISTRSRNTSGAAGAVLEVENRDDSDSATAFQVACFSQSGQLALAVRSGSAGTVDDTWNWRLKNNHEFEHNYGQLATGDFIMRGLTDANLFRADASADRVGIGAGATPAATLHVGGSVRFSNLTTTPAIGDVLTATSVNGDLDWAAPAVVDSGETYIVSNDNTLRTINANAITGFALRDLVCTLIRDLHTAGVLTV